MRIMSDAREKTPASSPSHVEEHDRAAAYPFREMERRARARWRDEGLFEIRDPMAAKRPFIASTCSRTCPATSTWVTGETTFWATSSCG
jgi:hypothetical protein